jgi:23S rRNA (guanosine2251-2'-O)-methyltransferase
MAKKYMLLYGKKSVLERLKKNPQSIKKIIKAEGFSDQAIGELIIKNKISDETVSAKKVQDLKRAKNVQGIVAKVEHFKYHDFGQLLDKAQHLSLVFLDRVNDPHNLGVIIRSLACFGGFAIIIPDSHAVQVTEAVMHVASGGENYLPIAKVGDILEAVKKAKQQGIKISGAVIDKTAASIHNTGFSFPLAIVLGAETTGISREIQQVLDQKLFIPMPGADLSFNVAMAATVLGYEISRQRK